MFSPIETDDIIHKCVGTSTPVKIRVLEATQDKDVFLVEQVADDKREGKDKVGPLRTCIRRAEHVEKLMWIRSANQWCFDDKTAKRKKKNKTADVIDLPRR